LRTVTHPDALELIPQPFEVHKDDRLTYEGGTTTNASFYYKLTPEKARASNLIKVERVTAFETIYEA
jgi:hypothetical protein